MRKYVNFWGEYILGELGIALLVTALYCLFGVVLGKMNWNGAVLSSVLAVLPAYFLFSALFVHCILTINTFRMYTPVLLSLGLTRRAAIRQQLGTNALSMAAILLIGWLLLIGGPAVFSYQPLLKGEVVLLAGGELLIAGFSIFMGTLVMRFGNKFGILIGMVVGAVFGGMSAVAINLTKSDIAFLSNWLTGSISLKPGAVFVVVGAAVYFLSWIFTVGMTRKIEAKL